MPGLERQEYQNRLRGLRLLVMDVDGVLTDGSIIYGDGGWEGKVFHVRDGSAMYIARLVGLRTAVITGRTSAAVERRFSELPVDHVFQGTLDKLAACREVQGNVGCRPEQIAFVGDDLLDLPVMEYVGLGITVADAHEELRRRADWVTRARGGRGVAREVVDDFVTARELWDVVLADYRDRQTPAADAGVGAVADAGQEGVE